MYNKKTIIFLVILITSLVLSICSYNYLKQSAESTKETETIKVISEEIEIVDLPTEKNEEKLEKESLLDDTTINETKDVKEEVQVNQTTTFDNNYPDEANSQIPASVPEVIETNPIQEQTNPSSTQTAWERLGVSEYDYYNKPIFSWERVDFSVSEYGSLEAAYEACLNYGDNYEPYLNGQVLYRCGDVATLSGDYIGVMFSTEDLIY